MPGDPSQQSPATGESIDALRQTPFLTPALSPPAQIIDLTSPILDPNGFLGDCWACSFNHSTDDAAAHWKNCASLEYNSVRMTLNDHAEAKRVAKFEFGRLKVIMPAGGLASALDFLTGVWQRDEIQGFHSGKPLASLESIADEDLARWSYLPLYNVVHQVLSKARYQIAAILAIKEAAGEVFGNERARQSAYGELPGDPDGYRSEPWKAEELQWLQDFVRNSPSPILADVAKAFNDHFKVPDSTTGMGRVRDPVSVRLKIEPLFSQPGSRAPADLSAAEKAWLLTVYQLSNEVIVQKFRANAAKSGWRSRSSQVVLNFVEQCRAQARAAGATTIDRGTGQRSTSRSEFLRQLASARCTDQKALESIVPREGATRRMDSGNVG